MIAKRNLSRDDIIKSLIEPDEILLDTYIVQSLSKANIDVNTKLLLNMNDATVVEPILKAVLEEAIKRIAKKVAEGKKLTDSEVMLLVLDQMNKRIESRFETIEAKFEAMESRFEGRFKELESRFEGRFKEFEAKFKSLENSIASLKDYVNGRLNEMSRRIDDLSANIRVLSGRIDGLTKEVSSIKSDVIALMKEKLEEK